jgi:hypothetical protein
MYDALYDVGSDEFKALRDNDPENIDKFKQSYDLWEFYVDFRRGPWIIMSAWACSGIGIRSPSPSPTC